MSIIGTDLQISNDDHMFEGRVVRVDLYDIPEINKVVGLRSDDAIGYLSRFTTHSRERDRDVYVHIPNDGKKQHLYEPSVKVKCL